MDQFLLWTPVKENILTLPRILNATTKHHQAHDKGKQRYACFTIMLPTLMINLVSLTRTEAALENIIDTLVFPVSDK